MQRFVEARGNGDPFDVIIMDMQMPIVDGLTASKNLRSAGCECPILALTAATMQGEKERCIMAGCDAYLSKPVEESALLSCVKDLLSTKRNVRRFTESSTDRIVLLVEDNADARRATRDILMLLGWQVLEAESGAEAHRSIGDKEPLLALVDLSLPDVNGYELIEELRREGLSSTQFITLSGHASDEERQDLAGIKQHLTKPLGLTELKEALSQFT